MAEVEIKDEIHDENPGQCRACLSIGRKMLPIGECSSLYTKIAYDYSPHNPIPPLTICWECHALLKRLLKFQTQVRKANEMLISRQNFILGTLSNLTTVVLNDTHMHTIYLTDHTNIQTDMKNERYKEPENIHSDDLKPEYPINDDSLLEPVKAEESVVDDDDDAIDVTATDIATDVLIDVKKKNKWAQKRALQNKKPKFKILSNRKELFIKRKVSIEEVQRSLEVEKTSDRFQSTTHKCSLCVVSFEKNSDLMKHKKLSHNPDNPYTCDVCQSKLPDRRHLAAHIKNHTYVYNCKLCDYACSDRLQRNQHVEKQHRKVLQCLKCGLIFNNRREFFPHFKEWHENFICDLCGVSFKMRYCIKNHIKKQHSPLQCKRCAATFSNYKALWTHSKAHEGGARALCAECGLEYADERRYRAHLATSARHRAPRRVQCTGCDKVFSKRVYMMDHYNMVHLKNYKNRCEECDKNFIRNADLLKHKRRVHLGILPPKDKICNICGRGFTTKRILSNHLRTHTGERPFACARCPARFAQAAALRGHARALHRQ